MKFETLTDLRYAASTEEGFRSIITKCDEKQDVNIARLRRACFAVVSAIGSAQTDDTVDVDTELPGKDLADLRGNFQMRHRCFHPPQRSPGSRLISRLKREIDRRLLTVFELALAQTQAAQRASRKVKTQLAVSARVAVVAEEEAVDERLDISAMNADTIAGFLALLWVYLLALAIAGICIRAGASTAPESLTTDSLQYREVPLEVCQKYYWRVALALERCQNLSMVKEQDRTERAEWVQMFQDPMHTSKSLGDIIQIVLDRRTAHWDLARTQPAMRTPPNIPAAEGAAPPKKAPLPDAPVLGTNATVLRDGTRLCARFNSSKGCKRSDCARAHRCSFTQQSGRVCGSFAHGYMTCPDHKRRGDAQGIKRGDGSKGGDIQRKTRLRKSKR